jgi:hypothetical protein
MTMPTTNGVSPQLPQIQKSRTPLTFVRPDSQRLVTFSSAAFLPNPVSPNALSKAKLHLVVKTSIARANYTIVAQSRLEVMVPDNSPSHSMWPYLVNSAQTGRLNEISVYAHRGTSRDQARLLYMNAGALDLWREMGMPGSVVGEVNRPPCNAVLSFGMSVSSIKNGNNG